MKAYYAHCMALYNTPQEKRDIQLLQELGFEVVNPGSAEIAAAVKDLPSGEAMAYFERFADECDVIVFRGLPGGAIPAGVAKELQWFADRGKGAIELPTFALRTRLDRDATRLYLREVGNR